MMLRNVAEKVLTKEKNGHLSGNDKKALEYYNIGIAKGQKGDWRGAEKDLTKSLKLNPNNVNAYHCRGYGRNEMGEFRGALEDMNTIIKLKPNYKYATYNRDLMEKRINCVTAVIDIETTGLFYDDKIIDIGIVKYRQGKMIKKISQMVNPGFTFSALSTGITGITNGMVKNKPKINRLRNNIIKLLSDVDYILIHNGSYSIPYLQKELGIRIFNKKKTIDLLTLSRFLDFNVRGSNTLDATCKRYKVKRIKNSRVLHNAIAIYKCFWKIIHKHGFTIDEAVARFRQPW